MNRSNVVVGVLVGALAGAGTMLLVGQPATPEAAAYKAPRIEEGHPDFQGVWQAVNSAAWNILPHEAMWDVPPGVGVVEGDELPYHDWAREQQKKNFAMRATEDPDRRCYYPGVPRVMYLPHPFQIVQDGNVFEMLFEYGHYTRLIYLNGYPHHEEIPFWMGDSRGKWEGETLVVDTRNFYGQTWFDKAGNFHSDAMKLMERFTRTGPDHLLYEVTVDDPKVFTKPWKMSMPLYRRVEKNIMPLEYECMALDVYENRRMDKLMERFKNNPPTR
jgi:hypothetical protein